MEGFLRQLEAALEALGPDETREVVAEVRGLLEDALADAAGGDDDALAGFGGPEALAARVLEERGVHAVPTRVPVAPNAARSAALVVDGVLWLGALVLTYVLVALPSGIVAWGGDGRLVAVALLVVLAGTAVAGSVWWWAVWRRRPGTPTSGMALLGLRRIRIAGRSRMVRVADIPGALRPSRVWPAVKIAGALALVALLVGSVAQGSRSAVAQDQAAALRDAALSVSVVTEAYRVVITDGPPDQAAGLFHPSARPVLDDLVGRRRDGLVDAYTVRDVGADPSGRTSSDLSATGGRVRLPVVVCEYRADQEFGCYQYLIVCDVTADHSGGSTGAWWIESARKV